MRLPSLFALISFAAACAPTSVPETTPAAATAVPACDDGGCACGAQGAACCAQPPRCVDGLTCIDGRCAVPTPRCVASGIFAPGFLTTVFPASVGPGTPKCAEIPRELGDPTTPGTFRAPAPEIGALACEGLTPGTHRLSLRASVRAQPPIHHLVGACHCGNSLNLRLAVEQRDGPSWTIDTPFSDGNDHQCLRGPDVEWSQMVTVEADGRLRVRVDLVYGSRGVGSTVLFLRGAALSLDAVTP